MNNARENNYHFQLTNNNRHDRKNPEKNKKLSKKMTKIVESETYLKDFEHQFVKLYISNNGSIEIRHDDILGELSALLDLDANSESDSGQG
jgi:hypothetical protein